MGPVERSHQSLNESYKLAVGGEPVAVYSAPGVLAEMFQGDIAGAGLIEDKHHRHGRDKDPQPPVSALLVGYLDKVHPASLVDMPVVFTAVDFRQQEIEGRKERLQLLQHPCQGTLADFKSLHPHDHGHPVQWDLEKEFHDQDMGQKSVGEFPLGYDLGRLGSGDRSLAAAVADVEGLLAYMLLEYGHYLIVDLVRYFIEVGDLPAFPADMAIQLIIRDLMKHFDLGNVGDLASMALMTESGAPLPALIWRTIIGAIATTCLLITLSCRLLFGGTAKNGAIALVEQCHQALIILRQLLFFFLDLLYLSGEMIYHAILLPDNQAIRKRANNGVYKTGQIFLKAK